MGKRIDAFLNKLPPIYRYYEMGEELDISRIETFGVVWIGTGFLTTLSDVLPCVYVALILISAVKGIEKQNKEWDEKHKEVTIWQKD